jgi:hypothetical protein
VIEHMVGAFGRDTLEIRVPIVGSDYGR